MILLIDMTLIGPSGNIISTNNFNVSKPIASSNINISRQSQSQNNYGGYGSQSAQNAALQNAVRQSQKDNPEAWKKSKYEHKIKRTIVIPKIKPIIPIIAIANSQLAKQINSKVRPVQPISKIKPIQQSLLINSKVRPVQPIKGFTNADKNYLKSINPGPKPNQSKINGSSQQYIDTYNEAARQKQIAINNFDFGSNTGNAKYDAANTEIKKKYEEANLKLTNADKNYLKSINPGPGLTDNSGFTTRQNYLKNYFNF